MGVVILMTLLVALAAQTISQTSGCSTINGAMTYQGKTYLFFENSYVSLNSSTKFQESEGQLFEWGGLKAPINAAIEFKSREAALFFRFPRFFAYMLKPGYGTWTSRMRESFIDGPIDAAAHWKGVAYFMKGCHAISWDYTNQISTKVDLSHFHIPCNVDAAWEEGEDMVLVKGNNYWVMKDVIEGPYLFDNKYHLSSRTLCPSSPSVPASSGVEWFWEKMGFNKTQRSEADTLRWANDAAGYWSFRWATKQLPVLHFGHCGNHSEHHHARHHPADCDVVEAALSHNGNTYLFKGDNYVTLDASNHEVNISHIMDWGGLTRGARAAVVWTSSFPVFFFKRWRYYSYYLGELHGPHDNKQWGDIIHEGLDAAARKGDFFYFMKGCDYKTYDPKEDKLSNYLSLTSLGLPCDVDASWSDNSGNVILLKDDQYWTWGDHVSGPEPLSNLVTLSSWTLCKSPDAPVAPVVSIV